MKNKPNFKIPRLIALVALIVLVGFFGSCKNDPNNPSQSANTEHDVQAFAEKIETTISEGNPNFLNQRFEFGAMVKNIVDNINADPEVEMQFMQNMLTTINLGNQIASSLGFGGRFDLLKVQDDLIRYRLVYNNQFDYIDFLLDLPASESDSIMIKDVYIYNSAIPFSTTLTRLMIRNVEAPTDTTFTDRLREEDLVFANNASAFDSIASLIEAKDYKAAKAFIDQLPQDFAKDKMVQLIKLNVTYMIDSLSYSDQLNALKQQYPNDAAIDIIEFNYALSDDNREKALDVLDNIDKRIGGDANLNVVQADIYVSLNDTIKAAKKIDQAIARENDLEHAYWRGISLAISQGKYDKAVGYFEPLQKEFDFNPATYLVEDGYTDFWTSDAYLKWEQNNPMPDSLKHYYQNPQAQGLQKVNPNTIHDGHDHEGHNHEGHSH